MRPGGSHSVALQNAVSTKHLPILKNHHINTFLFRKPQSASLSLTSVTMNTKLEKQFRSFVLNCAPRSLNVETPNFGEARLSAVDMKEEGKPSRDPKLRAEVNEKIANLKSNAEKAKEGQGGRARLMQRHTLGVDLGDVKTGLAITLGGFAPRPLTVIRQKGDKLLQTIIQTALQEKADEFVVGLPKAWDGQDTEQSKKCRILAGRLASLAAKRGWRVYLQDEYGTSQDALSYMIDSGSNRRSRKEQLDAYAAMALLCNYFDAGGAHAQLVIPKKLNLQQLLCQGPLKPLIADPDYDDDFDDFDDD